MSIYIPGTSVIFRTSSKSEFLKITKEMCIIPRSNILGDIALYCGASLEEYDDFCLLTFQDADKSLKFYQYATIFLTLSYKEIEEFPWIYKDVVNPSCTSHLVQYSLSTDIPRQKLYPKADNTIPVLKLEDSLKLQALFAVVFQLLRDCSLDNLAYLSRAFSEDFDLLLIALHDCGIIHAVFYYDRYHNRHLSRGYARSCFLHLSEHIKKPYGDTTKILIRDLENKCSIKLTTIEASKKLNDVTYTELNPLAFYDHVRDARNHLVHFCLPETLGPEYFSEVAYTCQTVARIALILLERYYLTINNTGIITDLVSCIPIADIHLNLRVLGTFLSITNTLSVDEVSKILKRKVKFEDNCFIIDIPEENRRALLILDEVPGVFAPLCYEPLGLES